MKFRELLNETEEVVIPKKLVPVQQKFKEDVLGEKETIKENRMPGKFEIHPETEKDILEEEDVDEDIKDAQVSQISDEELDKLLDAIAKTDDEKDALIAKKREIRKAMKGKSKEEIDKELEKIDPLHKDISQPLAQRMRKLIHRSNLFTTPEGGKLKKLMGKTREDVKQISREDFTKLVKQRPEQLIGQNKKLGGSGGSNYIFYDLTMPAYQGLFLNEKTGKFEIIKTCPSAKECLHWCFASKGGYIQYPSSSLNASRVVTFLMNDYDGFVKQLGDELDVAKKKADKENKQLVLRWHDAGDVVSPDYLDMMVDIAKKMPDILFYAYTKNLPVVRAKEIPKNLSFTFSFGGEHDDSIKTDVEKHARVVKRSLFKQVNPKIVEIEVDGKKVETYDFTDEKLKQLKELVAKEFKLKPETVISYPELVKMPYDHKKDHEKKWNVLVWKGHGDDAAMRHDVLGVYLLEH